MPSILVVAHLGFLRVVLLLKCLLPPVSSVALLSFSFLVECPLPSWLMNRIFGLFPPRIPLFSPYPTISHVNIQGHSLTISTSFALFYLDLECFRSNTIYCLLTNVLPIYSIVSDA